MEADPLVFREDFAAGEFAAAASPALKGARDPFGLERPLRPACDVPERATPLVAAGAGPRRGSACWLCGEEAKVVAGRGVIEDEAPKEPEAVVIWFKPVTFEGLDGNDPADAAGEESEPVGLACADPPRDCKSLAIAESVTGGASNTSGLTETSALAWMLSRAVGAP